MSSPRIETVLIGTTLSPAGDPFVVAGIHLARSMGARVHLVHAYDLPLIYGGAPFVAEMPVTELVEGERRALQERLDRQILRLGLGAEEIAGMTLELGAAHRVLIEAAERIAAAVIVLGAVESPAPFSRLFGSTADRVVRKADRPVLLVRREMKIPPTRVLLPVDLSALSTSAFRQGIELLGRIGGCRDAELETFLVRTESDGRHLHPEVEPRFAEAALAEATRDLGAFLAGETVTAGWRVTPRVELGFVDRQVLARIANWHPDVVVLGTHGRGGFERFVLGSVATSVIRESGANVLVIPPDAARAGFAVPALETVAV